MPLCMLLLKITWIIFCIWMTMSIMSRSQKTVVTAVRWTVRLTNAFAEY